MFCFVHMHTWVGVGCLCERKWAWEGPGTASLWVLGHLYFMFETRSPIDLQCHHVDQASPQASKYLPVSPLLEPQEHTITPSFYFYMCSGREGGEGPNSGVHVCKASILVMKPSLWPMFLFVETGFHHVAQASVQLGLLPQPLQTKPYNSFTTELERVWPRQSNDLPRVTRLVKGRATHENELCFPSDFSESNHWDLQYFTGSSKVSAPEQWPEVT